jgi:CheY-like chemotaxis protein
MSSSSPLVLVVEDSPTQAQKLSAMLNILCGIRVILASEGVEALNAVDKHQPDLVILDVNLPGLNGYQVCKRLRRDQRTAHIPIIMLTSSDSAGAALQGLEAGADDYIPKDVFATENLMTALRSYLKFA